MNWKTVLGISFGISFGIGYGIFSWIIEELIDSGDSFLLVGGFILATLLGLLSENKYLSFATVLSGFVTFQVMAIYYWGTEYEIEPLWLLPFLAVIYSVPWIFFKSMKKAGKKGKKSTINCPRCGNKIEKNWVSCPHCGMKIKEDTRIYNTPEDTRVY